VLEEDPRQVTLSDFPPIEGHGQGEMDWAGGAATSTAPAGNTNALVRVRVCVGVYGV
jgi:hypothetical protein